MIIYIYYKYISYHVKNYMNKIKHLQQKVIPPPNVVPFHKPRCFKLTTNSQNHRVRSIAGVVQ